MPASIPLAPLPELPREEFWRRYNQRLEFPLSTAAAVLLHAAVAALLMVILVHLMNGPPRDTGVAISLVEPMGLDDDGEGTPGSGIDDPRIPPDANNPLAARDPGPMINPIDLPRVESDIRKYIGDETGTIPIAPDNARNYALVDEKFREKLFGGKPGAGGKTGTGASQQPGAGPGGDGAASSRARSLRWVLRFSTTDGPDYLEHLAALDAVILVPLPPDNRDCLLFPNLRKPGERRPATEADWKNLAGQVRFGDSRPDSVRSVCTALGVGGNPRTFWAFFPKRIEEELARKEIGYRNRQPANIAETVFRIALRGGTAEITAIDQTPKR